MNVLTRRTFLKQSAILTTATSAGLSPIRALSDQVFTPDVTRRPAATDGTIQFWQVADRRTAILGASKHSDVSVRSLYPHPASPDDPYNTLDMALQFHITRLEWTYGLTQSFVKKAKDLGLIVGGALEDDTADAKGSKNFGRVTGQDGKLKKHQWFPNGRWVGCANAPEYMAATLLWARRNVDAGVDVMQQDDPEMAIHCVPPFCYCNYCKEKFIQYQNRHGKDASYEQFQKDSILAFHKEMHQRLDAYAGRHIPFSCNNRIGWVSPAFDFILAEFYDKTVSPTQIFKTMQDAGGIPLSFQYRQTSVQNNRRGLAAFYAVGATMLMPWDVYITYTERYFGKPEDYADLSGFIRGNAGYLDDYENAAASGPGIQETRYGASTPIAIAGGSGEVFAFVRARHGDPNASVVIHLVEWGTQNRPFTLRLQTANFFGGKDLKVSLRTPMPYDAELHQTAQAQGDFTKLVNEVPLKTTVEDNYTVLQVPALRLWGILIVTFQEGNSQ